MTDNKSRSAWLDLSDAARDRLRREWRRRQKELREIPVPKEKKWDVHAYPDHPCWAWLPWYYWLGVSKVEADRLEQQASLRGWRVEVTECDHKDDYCRE